MARGRSRAWSWGLALAMIAFVILLIVLVGRTGGAPSAPAPPRAAAPAPTTAAEQSPPRSAPTLTTPARAAPTSAAPARAAPTTTRASGASAPSRDEPGTISFDRLPPEARQTLALIDRGGPFPYSRDGLVFENRERLLPIHPRGYYREYTVETPGSPDRGARRIVTGTGGEVYYTDDHYDSFRRVIRR